MVIKVECIGVNPSCLNCKRAEINALKAAEKLKIEGVDVVVEKLDIMSPELINKYGLLMSPAIAVNGVLKSNGKVPEVRVIEEFIEGALHDGQQE